MPRLEASPLVGQVVAPGDVVLDLNAAKSVIRVGGGLQQEGEVLVATKGGRLCQASQNKLWLEGSQRRYIPAAEDVVLGMVVEKHGEHFAVDISGAFPAILPILSFEGATRRNRPNMGIGAVVYARVVKASRDADPEIACVDVAGKSSGFGPMTGGYVFSCSTGLARALLSRPTCPVLAALGEKLPFEIAVGMNGRVWVNAAKPATTILISNAIMNAEFLSANQTRTMVQKLLQRAE